MRLILVGGSGLLGSALALGAKARGAQVVIVSRTPKPSPRWESVSVDVGACEAIRTLSPMVAGADHVINLAAVTDVDRCESEDSAEVINADWPVRLAAECARHKVALTQISTDAAYSLKAGSASEQDMPSPLNAYAKQKVRADAGVLEVFPQACVVRMSFFGWSPQPHRGLAGWLVHALRRGTSVKGFADVVFNPLYTGHASEILLDLVGLHASGIIHLGARACCSKLEFARGLAATFELGVHLIDPGSLQDANLAAPRPHRTCLSTLRAQRLLGRSMPTLQEALVQMKLDEVVLRTQIETQF